MGVADQVPQTLWSKVFSFLEPPDLAQSFGFAPEFPFVELTLSGSRLLPHPSLLDRILSGPVKVEEEDDLFENGSSNDRIVNLSPVFSSLCISNNLDNLVINKIIKNLRSTVNENPKVFFQLKSIEVICSYPDEIISEILDVITSILRICSSSIESVSINIPIRIEKASRVAPFLDLRGITFRKLFNFHIGTCVLVDRCIQISLTDLVIDLPNKKDFQEWFGITNGLFVFDKNQNCDMSPNLQGYFNSLHSILYQSQTSLINLTVNGSPEIKLMLDIFGKIDLCLPKLKSLSLGWTSVHELASVLLLCKGYPLQESVSELLMDPSSAPSLMACWVHPNNKKIRNIKNNNSLTSKIKLLRVPSLEKLKFNGPTNVGLTDIHLAVYSAVNQLTPRGVSFRYGLFSASFEGVINFRVSLSQNPFFTMFMDKDLAVFNLDVQGLDPEGNEEKLKEWQSYLTYKHVDIIKQNRTSVQSTATKYPQVNYNMTGEDLFALEMWQAPFMCKHIHRDVFVIWSSYLTSDQRSFWCDNLLPLYLAARCCEGFFSFEKIKPWWRN